MMSKLKQKVATEMDINKEEYVSLMMSKLKLRIAAGMHINIEELDYRLEGRRTPPASKRPSMGGASALVTLSESQTKNEMKRRKRRKKI